MMKILEKTKFNVEYDSKLHKRKLKKPNEDKLFCDSENGIFILLDGITRVHNEYEEAPYTSAAAKVGEIFIDEVYNYIMQDINNPFPELLLKGAISTANAKLNSYRQIKSQKDWGFYPATLGFISLLRENTLYYVNAGDCIATLIRRNSKILFGCEWALEALEKLDITKKERYQNYCNHPHNPLSYTVFNGDDEVELGLEYSYIDTHAGDTLIIASDGISNYIKYEKIQTLLSQSVTQMIEDSYKYDVPPYAEYADDKSLIKISFI